jgi:predicted metal-dependent hydrolase
MSSLLQLGSLPVRVFKKKIRNIHLSVHPPTGQVVVSCPERYTDDQVRALVISKMPWIRSQQRSFQNQERDAPAQYRDRESHWLWGRRLLLRVVPAKGAAHVEVRPKEIHFAIKPDWDSAKREELFERWMRGLLMEEARKLITRWEPILGVRVERLSIRRMKTKWGSCTPSKAAIALNTELAKKPRPCLEYIVVHEMLHLLEPTHNEKFRALLTQFLPRWKDRRRTLNSLPIRHEKWTY